MSPSTTPPHPLPHTSLTLPGRQASDKSRVGRGRQCEASYQPSTTLLLCISCHHHLFMLLPSRVTVYEDHYTAQKKFVFCLPPLPLVCMRTIMSTREGLLLDAVAPSLSVVLLFWCTSSLPLSHNQGAINSGPQLQIPLLTPVLLRKGGKQNKLPSCILVPTYSHTWWQGT